MHYLNVNVLATTSIGDIVSIAGFVLWTLISVVLILFLRILSPKPLLDAPPRYAVLSVIHLAGVALLYYGAAVLSQVLMYASAGVSTTQATQPISDPAFAAKTQIAFSIAILLPAALIIFLAKISVKGGLRGFGLHIKQLPAGIAKGLLAFAITMPLVYLSEILVIWIMELLGRKELAVHPVITMIEKDELPKALVILLTIGATVLAPFAEELFFRGLLQTIFIQPFQFIIGVGAFRGTIPEFRDPSPSRRILVISIIAALFASIHYDFNAPNPEHLPVLFLFGAALGYTYERTGNLWASMTLHASFNAFVLISASLPDS